MQTESAIRLMQKRVPEYKDAWLTQKEAACRVCYVLFHREGKTPNILWKIYKLV